MLAVLVKCDCFVVDDRRGMPSKSGRVCSDREVGGSSSTSAMAPVVAAHEYCPAALASMFLLSMNVTANLIRPINAYMTNMGGYVSFQLMSKYVRWK